MIAYMVPFFAVPSTVYPVPAPDRILTLSPLQRTYCAVLFCVDGADEVGADEVGDEDAGGTELCGGLLSDEPSGSELLPDSVSSSVGGCVSISELFKISETEPLGRLVWVAWFLFPQAERDILANRKSNAHSHVIQLLIFFIFTSFH